MKGLIKVLVGIVIVFVAIVLVVGGALKLYFSQEKIIALVKPQIEKATHRKIDIQGAEFSLLKGFVLKGLAIKEEDGKNNFVTLREFSISYELWPLLEKKLKVNSISLIDPKISLVRYKNGAFNYESIVAAVSQGEKAPSKVSPPGPPAPTKVTIPIAITLNNVSISNARILFRDEMGELPNAEANVNIDTDLDISTTGTINYSGEMDLEAVSKIGELPTKMRSRLTFDSSKISINGEVSLDEWRLKLAGSVKDYSTQSPKAEFNMYSKKLDLDAIRLKMAPFFEAFKGHPQNTKNEVKSTAPAPLIPPIPPMVQAMEATGTIEVKELIYCNLPIKDVKVVYLLRDGRLRVKKEIGDLSGGKLASNVTLDLTDKAIPFKGDVNVKGVELSGIMHLLAPKLVGVIVGDIDTRLAFSGSALTQGDITKTLILQGTYGLSDGKIMRNPITIALSRLLNMKELEEPSFDSVTGNINLVKGWVIFKSIFSSRDIKASVERGRVSLEGSLDVPLTMELSKELSQRLVAKQGALRVLLNDDGIAELPVAIKGSYSHPRPTLNMKKAKDQLIKGVIKGFLGR